MLRSLRTCVPSLRTWHHTAVSDTLTLRGTLPFSTEVTGQVVELTSDKEYADALSALRDSGALAVVDYTAKWCGPCKMIAPLFSKFSQEFTDVKFYRVDIDEDKIAQTVAEAGVASVPTFTFHKGGERVASFSGADPSQLRAHLEELRE